MISFVLTIILAATVNGGIPTDHYDAEWHRVCGDPHAYFSSTLGGDGDSLCGNFGLLPVTTEDEVRLYEYILGESSFHIDAKLTKVNGRTLITELHFYFPFEVLRITLNEVDDIISGSDHQWDGAFDDIKGDHSMSLHNGLVTYEFTPALKVLVTKMGGGLCFEIVEFHRQFEDGYLGRLHEYSIQQTGPSSGIATRNNMPTSAINVNKVPNSLTGTCWEIPDAASFQTFFDGVPEDFDGHILPTPP